MEAGVLDEGVQIEQIVLKCNAEAMNFAMLLLLNNAVGLDLKFVDIRP